MRLTSPAFENQTPIPAKYTCKGDGVNPPLAFSDVPASTVSLVLIVDDPDAPSGDWVHWVVFNLDPKTAEILEHSTPGGIEGVTSFGENKYGAPCPPSGTHRYFFKLYALDSQLNLAPTADKNGVEIAMQGHILEQVELVGLFSK